MSWNQPQPSQRYSAVPGFEDLRPASMVGGSPATPNTPMTDDDRSGSGYELDQVPPAHRATLYADPFNDGSQAALNSNSNANSDASMNPSAHGRSSHKQYNRLGEPAMAGMAGGAAAGAAGYGAYRGAQGGPGGQGAYSAGPSAGQGYSNGYSYSDGYNNGGYSQGGPQQGFSASQPQRDNMTADELWAMETGKEPVPNSYQYEEPAQPKSKKKLWIWLGVLLGLAAIGGIVAGVVVSQMNKKSNGSSSGKSGSGNSTSGDGTALKDPNDPSNFDKDERLHNVFWGMAYQPDGAIPPACGANLASVTRDMQILSQLTTRLRLYGANCNMTALVLQAIKDTKVQMEIYPAIYIDSNTEAYTEQTNAILDAFQTYGVDNVAGLAVGNEYLLNQGNSAPSGSKYLSDVKKLLSYVSQVKTKVQGLSLSKTMPVGTGDAGSLMSTTLAQGLDFYMANVHPWFGQVPVDQAAGWTWDYFTENDVKPAMAASNQPPTYIAETGWPTQYMAPQGGDTGQDSGNPPSDATDAQLQTFLDTFVCQANKNETHYFFFEPFDQEWKEPLYGGVEPFWGLFDKNRVLKNIVIPSCT